MNQMKRIVMTGAILLSSLVSFNAVAAEQSPEQQAAAAVANRQAVFKLLAVSNGVLGGMQRGAPYDADAAILATERIEMLAEMIPSLFTADTTKVNHGATTRAADTIWAGKADFDQLAADLAAGAVAAREILSTRGAEGIRDAVGQIGPKCGACHDRFRLD
jgi:cytochrome c556